jgi:hypothetical protein
LKERPLCRFFYFIFAKDFFSEIKNAYFEK